MKLSKDLKVMLEPFLAAGFSVHPTRGKHTLVLGPDGRAVTTLSSTPSDNRAMLNARAQLRRALREAAR